MCLPPNLHQKRKREERNKNRGGSMFCAQNAGCKLSIPAHQKWCCWSPQLSGFWVCIKGGLQSAFSPHSRTCPSGSNRGTLFQSVCQTQGNGQWERQLSLEEAMCPTAVGKYPYRDARKDWVPVPPRLFSQCPLWGPPMSPPPESSSWLHPR